jgi:hypothetical protein
LAVFVGAGEIIAAVYRNNGGSDSEGAGWVTATGCDDHVGV